MVAYVKLVFLFFVYINSRLIMLVKLFLVMGISWTFEALFSIFSITDTSVLRDVEAVIDCFNASQGYYNV